MPARRHFRSAGHVLKTCARCACSVTRLRDRLAAGVVVRLFNELLLEDVRVSRRFAAMSLTHELSRAGSPVRRFMNRQFGERLQNVFAIRPTS